MNKNDQNFIIQRSIPFSFITSRRVFICSSYPSHFRIDFIVKLCFKLLLMYVVFLKRWSEFLFSFSSSLCLSVCLFLFFSINLLSQVVSLSIFQSLSLSLSISSFSKSNCPSVNKTCEYKIFKSIYDLFCLYVYCLSFYNASRIFILLLHKSVLF